MSYRREGEKNNFFFVAFLSIFLVTSTILLPIFTLTSTNDLIIYEKSTAPNSNNSLINTTLELRVDDIFTSALEGIQVEVNQLVNLTVFYRDNATKQHISGATVSLGWDNFTETGSQYYYNLDTDDLEQGITIVTIEAQYDN